MELAAINIDVKSHKYLKLLWLQLPCPVCTNRCERKCCKGQGDVNILCPRIQYLFATSLDAFASPTVCSNRCNWKWRENLHFYWLCYFLKTTCANRCLQRYMCLLGWGVPSPPEIFICCNCRCNFCEPCVTTDVSVSVSEDRGSLSHRTQHTDVDVVAI